MLSDGLMGRGVRSGRGMAAVACALVVGLGWATDVAWAQRPPTQRGAPSLREAGDDAGVLVGTAVVPELLKDSRYAEVLAREFNVLVPQDVMAWGNVHPQAEQWNFEPVDTLMAFAEKHKMKVIGHALVNPRQLPAYINAEMSADQMRAALREHITKLVGHYKGKVYAWNVVCDAVDDQEGLRKSVLLEKLGEDYIADAFRAAHEADPDALLLYDDHGADALNAKSDRVYELVRKLWAAQVPVRGVGLQMHLSVSDPPDAGDVAKNIDRLRKVGLLVFISAMDVRTNDVPGDRADRLQAQGKVYRLIAAAALRGQSVSGITFWGFTDSHSWIDAEFGPDDPLLFDENYNAKPSYRAVLTALRVR